MPELPEIEVIRRGLQRHLPGRRIEAVFHNGKKLRCAVPFEAMQKVLTGRKISRVSRRAKFLLLHMDNDVVLIIHLGMTGRLGIFPVDSPIACHDHVRWQLDCDLELRLHDTRRFGSVHLLTADQTMVVEKTFFRTTGPEPFSDDCSPQYLFTRAQHKKQPIKTFLMDMKIIAGIGNIYANECLFGAGINPSRPACSLTIHDWQRLLPVLRSILNHAIDCGGSTISDYLNASGERGYFQVHFKVYGKKDQPCPRCGTPIEKVQLRGRASYFCPECQKR
jgi:formamidopyrimidine-DNA glycosylase